MARIKLQEKGSLESPAKSSTLLWPIGMSRTTIRVHWHNRLSKLPAGLTLSELSDQLSEPYASVAFWANKIGYPFVRLKRGRKSSIDWESVDWKRRNCDLGRELGVTGERVRQKRLVYESSQKK